MKNYIVLDLEWNQSAGGKEETIPHFPFEIIEIGAVRLDEALKETGSFRSLVKPRVYPVLHEKIREVTHMDPRLLMEEGKDFKEAIRDFLDWCGPLPVFCTWGSMDLTELQRNMAYYNLPIPFPKPLLYYDVQKLYSLYKGYGKERLSLDMAVQELGIGGQGGFHQALSDAHYTGRVMASMDFKQMEGYWSTDYYRLPDEKSQEVFLCLPGYSKYISRPFETKEEAIEDKTVTDLLCPVCNRMLRKKVRWFSVNQKFYYCLGICPEHGGVKGKIRMKRNDEGDVYVVKTMKPADEAGANEIYEKKDEARKKRVEKMKARKKDKKDKDV